MRVTAVIMCSGFSRRMGENKLLMDFRGKRMFEYTVDTVKKAGFYKTVVVTAYDEIADYCSWADIIRNDEAIEGMSASVRLGVNNCGNCDGIMFFTADQPFIDETVINKLKTVFDETSKIVIPVVNGKAKNPVIFPIRFADELLLLKGESGGKKVYSKHIDEISCVVFDEEKPFIDFDYLADFDNYI